MWEDSHDRLKTPHRFTRLLLYKVSITVCRGVLLGLECRQLHCIYDSDNKSQTPAKPGRSRPFAQLTPASLPSGFRLEI